MELRLRANYEQFSVMLNFMETNGDLSRSQPGVQGRMNNDCQWNELVQLLNALPGGVKKPLDKWKRVWSDWKTKTKKKALLLRKNKYGSGKGKRKPLNQMEQRVLKIIGVGSITGIEEVMEEKLEIEELDLEVPTSPIEMPSCRVLLESPQDRSMLCTSPLPEVHNLEEETNGDPLTGQRDSATSELSTSSSRQHRQIRRRRRRLRPFEQAFSEFVQIEKARLRQEERRIQNEHEREMERIRIETLRIQMEERRTLIFEKVANAANELVNLMSRS